MKIVRSFILLSLFTAILSFNSSCQQTEKKSGVTQTVAIAEFKQRMEKGDAILLDVRTPDEYAEGHLAGSTNLDYENPNFPEELKKLDKSKPYLVYCRSGRRSDAAMQLMKENGFTSVTNLEGGIAGWQQAGMEVVR